MWTKHSSGSLEETLTDSIGLLTNFLITMRPEVYFMAIRLRNAVGLVLMLASCHALALGDPPQQFIGYRARDNGLTEVYEMTQNRVTFGGPGILGPRRFLSEFGGPIYSCADAQFHCFSSVLRVAVPREGVASSWTAGGNQCRVMDSPELSQDRTIKILCRSSEEQSVEFLFSRQRGILSYHRQCPGCFAGEYVLVTQTGLFASPNEH